MNVIGFARINTLQEFDGAPTWSSASQKWSTWEKPSSSICGVKSNTSIYSFMWSLMVSTKNQSEKRAHILLILNRPARKYECA